MKISNLNFGFIGLILVAIMIMASIFRSLTVVAICGSMAFILWGVEHLLWPEHLRSSFNDKYLSTQWYICLVRVGGVISMAAGLTVLWVYFQNR